MTGWSRGSVSWPPVVENDRGSISNEAVPPRPSAVQVIRPHATDVAPQRTQTDRTACRHHDLRNGAPRRISPSFQSTPRCVVWDLTEVEAWIEQRRKDSDARLVSVAPSQDVRLDGHVRSNCTRKLTGRRGSGKKCARCDNSSAVGRAIRGFIICPADLQIRLDSLLGISSSQSHAPRG
jgi:hypothetical protein